MPTDTKLNRLIINKLTQEQYDEAKAAGTLSDTEFYITDSDDEALTNNNISNCITEIPQDIKLELNGLTLKLKAGSKAYVPNGFEADGTTPKFDVKIIESDIIVDSPYIDGPMFIYYMDNTVVPVPRGWSISGTSNTITDNFGCWYDTTNNIIKIVAGDEVGSSGMSLPLAIVNGSSDGDWTSIDQVFNGFGYIGSTVFALPGVKGLIPNGRNADGSLKNIEFTINSVLTTQVTSNVVVGVRGNAIGSSGKYSFDEINNQNLNSGAFWNVATIGDVIFSSDKITSFTPKTVFHAVDWNEFAPVKDAIPTKQDIATAVNYNNISNCITEIPQDIKLELNNGTLTLKAGSKVYVPNGFESDGTTPKFDVVTITSDKSYFYTSVTLQGLLWITHSNNLDFVAFQNCYSGQVAPQNSGLWYDIANNLMKFSSDGGNTWFVQKSLPLAVSSLTSGIGATSIDQVFNGFGYIGSTVFALPGVKGLIPNGRNADGSLKNIEFTLDKVLTYNCNISSYFGINLEGTEPILGIYVEQLYNSTSNTVIFNGITYKWMYSGSLIYSNGRITSFTPKTVFHALDYNDKSTISGWGMPSGRFIDLTLGASGTNYIAPANGFFFVEKVSQAVGQFLIFNTANMEQESIAVVAGNWVGGFVPVKKGMNCTIIYTASGATQYFRFIYAEGE